MEVAMPDVSQSFQKTKGFLTEQVGKAVDSVSEATAQAKSSVRIQVTELLAGQRL